MPETIEEWARLLVAIIFIGFVVLVVGVIFHSLIVWLCLGLLAGILLFFPVIKNYLAKLNARRGHQKHGYKIDKHELPVSEEERPQSLESANKHWQLPAPKREQLKPGLKKPPLEDPDVQHYVPPGLPPDFFL